MENKNNKTVNEKRILNDVMFNNILKTGLVIVGGKDVGKSKTGMQLAYEIIKYYKNVQVKIFDPPSNYRWNFEPILYQEINDETRVFYDGDRHIIYDIDLMLPSDMMDFMTKVISTDYKKQRLRKKLARGKVDKWIVCIIEEGQNVIGTHSLASKKGQLILRFISEGRNFGLSYIVIGQRLANISPNAVEMGSSYFFGRSTGDNNIGKLRRIIGKSNSTIIDDIKKLEIEKGQFIYYDGCSAYDLNCPEYTSNTKPMRWTEIEDIPTWRYREGKRIF